MTLRPATMKDAQFLLKLKNDPVMRRYAVVTHSKIKEADHLKWLKDNLEGIFIIGDNWGMFRISKDKEVSINLAPEFRGQGIGSQVLDKCPKGVWAKIVNGNVPSMKLFLSHGFTITSYKENYYVLAN